MVLMLEAPPSFGRSLARNLGGGLGAGFSQGISQSREFAQQMALQKSRQNTEKLEEKRRGYEIGLGTIENMKSLIPKLGLSGYLNPIERMGAQQSYKSYANSLLGLLSTVPVRNQKEFESVKESLSNPTFATQEQLSAAINAAEDLLKRHMESLGGEEKRPEKEEKKEEKNRKTKFNPNNREHVAKMKQLEKTFKGDRKKVNEALAREFE